MEKIDILQNYYKERIEGGAHNNLRFTIIEYLISHKLKVNDYLDVGCADGSFTLQVAEKVGAKNVFGADLSRFALSAAEIKGIITYKLDLNKDKLPFNDKSIDLVTSFEMIEHLINTDNLILESYRVLKPGGHFIISTPNLASWINRIYLLLGIQPRNCELSLILKLDGIIKKNIKPVGHIRLYTLKSLITHLRYYRFNIMKILGCPQPISIHKHDPRNAIKLAGNIYNLIDRGLGRFPSYSNWFAIIAKK